MADEIVKEALAFSLGSDLHEAWRAPRKKADGTYEPRMKKSKDEEWNRVHGTDDVDIANCSFSELPSNWQYENLEAAKVVINLVFDKVMGDKQITPQDTDSMAAIVHNEWLKRNSWVFDPINGDPKLAVPYDQLDKVEKNKDKAQVLQALLKVHAYIDGIIDVEAICEQYNIAGNSKTM